MLAILSDIHSNIHALDAVLAECGRRGVKEFCCLGDVVGYGAFPAECVHRIRELGCPTVQGNHDSYVADGILDREVSPLARAGVDYSTAQLAEGERAWLRGLPLIHRWSELVTLVHSSLHEPREWHYVRVTKLAESSFQHQETPLCFFGHTHVAQIFLQRDGGRPEWVDCEPTNSVQNGSYLINPGSVGQPRNGDPLAQFAIFDPEKMNVHLVGVPYDIDAAIRGILAAGLPIRLGERLLLGQ